METRSEKHSEKLEVIVMSNEVPMKYLPETRCTITFITFLMYVGTNKGLKRMPDVRNLGEDCTI